MTDDKKKPLTRTGCGTSAVYLFRSGRRVTPTSVERLPQPVHQQSREKRPGHSYSSGKLALSALVIKSVECRIQLLQLSLDPVRFSSDLFDIHTVEQRMKTVA